MQTPFRYLSTLIEEEFGRQGIAPDTANDRARKMRSFSDQAIERFEARMRAMPIVAKRTSSPRMPEPPFPTDEPL